MSSGVGTPEDLKQSPQSAAEDPDLQDVSGTESSILYLLQEATKLATHSNQYSKMATEELVTHSKGDIASSTFFSNQNTLKAVSETQPSLTGSFSLLNNVQTSSPWEVMSLINLQCERLLHCRQTPEEDGDSYTSSATDEAECTDVMECASFGSTDPTEPHKCELSSTVTSRQITAEHDAKSDLFSSEPHVIDGTISNSTVDELNEGAKMSAIEDLAELISKNTADIFSNVGVVSEESSTYCPIVETSMDTSHQPLLQFPLNTQEGETSCATSMSETTQSSSPEISSVDFTSSLVDEKDDNSSMCFSFSSCENSELQSLPQPHQQDSAGVLIYRTDLNNNLEENKDDSLLELEVDQATPSAPHSGDNCRRTPRKQAHPERSPDLQNPELQGVTFSMHTELDRSTDQCRLLITSNYSEVCRRSRRIRRSRSRSLQSFQCTSSSEEESDPASLSKKICASCCTRKTPLWRDAEDGTPLCNACGIRYKKYRVRCQQCWNIPKKEANSNSKCLKCGDLLQLAAQNKRAGCHRRAKQATSNLPRPTATRRRGQYVHWFGAWAVFGLRSRVCYL
uniref:Zinc finger GATA like protein 1 n=2 Tax=Astyanax mexicanus TaxID=7994 RepID=A0A3B1JQR1_ASTMX